ncbi:hypothetical protein SAY86_029474 [Trapa natans]|uniref:Uncharacterized protein n=1 Tax=Trapa natans TaxID=22666 RepID=A0AAN7RHD8_TRANT|nr:hypothetical protein SAY86_029474 [Trapa natans]
MCFLKASLMDGRFIIGTNDSAYLRLPRSMIPSYQTRLESATLDCSNSPKDVLLQRVYSKSHDNKLWVKILLIVAGAIAVLEVLGVLLVWYFIAATRQTRKGQDGNQRLASWVRRNMNKGDVSMAAWIEEIVDQSVEDEFDGKKVEVLVAVALRCVANDKEKRPSMSKVVEILECLGNEAEN